MSKVGLSILVSIFMLAGCGNNNEENEVATLEDNIWVSESCNFQGIVDANGISHEIYTKSLYKFTEDNKLYIGNNIYSDENCINLVQKSIPDTINGGNMVYFDLGEIMTVDGYVQHGIRLTISDGAISIDDIKNGVSMDASYAINENRVCFSQLIYSGAPYTRIYTDSFGSQVTQIMTGFFIDSLTDRPDEIDFEDCLVKE